MYTLKNIIFLGTTLFCSYWMYADEVRVLQTYEHGYNLCITESQNNAINKLIIDGVHAYKDLCIGPRERIYFSVVITTISGEVIVGVTSMVEKSLSTKRDYPNICFLYWVWIDDRYQDPSLMQAVMVEWENYLKSKGCFDIQHQVFEVERDWKKFLEKNGFTVATTIPNFEGVSGRELYIMRKHLADQEVSSDASIDTTKYRMIVQDEWSQQYGQVINSKANALLRKQEGILSYSPYTIFVTADSGEVIAGAVGGVTEYRKGGKDGYLNWLWVHERYRKRGLGTKIMAAFIDYVQERGCTWIELSTAEWEARGFYEKLGFEIVATEPNFEGYTGFERYYMRKAL